MGAYSIQEQAESNNNGDFSPPEIERKKQNLQIKEFSSDSSEVENDKKLKK